MLIKTYHVFTDNRDDWVNTKKEAMQIIRAWKDQGHTNLRVYEEISEHGADDLVEENCIYSKGQYPY